jgi:hypothetical protein
MLLLIVYFKGVQCSHWCSAGEVAVASYAVAIMLLLPFIPERFRQRFRTMPLHASMPLHLLVDCCFPSRVHACVEFNVVTRAGEVAVASYAVAIVVKILAKIPNI